MNPDGESEDTTRMDLQESQTTWVQHARRDMAALLPEDLRARLLTRMDRICILLIGSAYSEHADRHSDVDVCVLMMEEKEYNAIRREREAFGRVQNETIVEETERGHCVIRAFSDVEACLRRYEEREMYVFGNALPIHDPNEVFQRMRERFQEVPMEVLREKVLEKMDHFRGRKRAYASAAQRGQVLIMLSILLEGINAALEIAALLDGRIVSTRKWLFEEATAGPWRKEIKPIILGTLGGLENFQKIRPVGHFFGGPFFRKGGGVGELLPGHAGGRRGRMRTEVF